MFGVTVICEVGLGYLHIYFESKDQNQVLDTMKNVQMNNIICTVVVYPGSCPGSCAFLAGDQLHIPP